MDFGQIAEKIGLAGILFYVIWRLEKAMGLLAHTMQRTNMILLVILKHLGMPDDEALRLVGGIGQMTDKDGTPYTCFPQTPGDKP